MGSKNNKRKKKHKVTSSITCIEIGCLDKSSQDNINASKVNDFLLKKETADGSYTENVSMTVCRGKTRMFCDPQAKSVIDVSVTCKNDCRAEIKCLSVDSSGKEPMLSEISSSHHDENRQLEKPRKKKRRLCASKNNSGNVSLSGLQAFHDDVPIEPEVIPLMRELGHIYSRRRKVKKHSEDLKNNSSILIKQQSELYVNDKSEPLDNVQEKPKLKDKYSKRKHKQKLENQRHSSQNILTVVSKSHLEALDSSQELSERVTCEAASTSERAGICSSVPSINNIRHDAISIQLNEKEDQSFDRLKVEASNETLCGASGSESQTCMDNVGETGFSIKEEIIREKSSIDKDDELKDVLHFSHRGMTMDPASVKGIVASVSAMEYCSSLNNVAEENGSTLLKLKKQDNDAIEQVITVEKPLVPIRKKLLVLDLNGLLVDILYVSNIMNRPYKRISGKSAFKRPYCDEFLDFCFEAFDIGVWSSRMRYNVDAVVDYVMGDRKKRLLFSWDQSKCTMTHYKTIENYHKPLVLKELIKLWDKEEKYLPWEKGEYTPSNTLLVDDSPYKALCNPPHTAVFPLPYRYDNEHDNSLGPGGDIRNYLEGLVMAHDVQDYVKENPFGQPYISEDHPSWKFYVQIIEDVKRLPHAAQN